MRNKRFRRIQNFAARLDDAQECCPDLESHWPYVEVELFALLIAYFDSIRKRLTETSDLEERAALLEEMESVIRAADDIIQRHSV